jgi:hypothetical protein
MSRLIAESSIAAGLMAKVRTAIRENGNVKSSAFVELFCYRIPSQFIAV